MNNPDRDGVDPGIVSVLRGCEFYSINERYGGISMRETYSVCRDGNGFVRASSKTGLIRIDTCPKEGLYPFSSDHESATDSCLRENRRTRLPRGRKRAGSGRGCKTERMLPCVSLSKQERSTGPSLILQAREGVLVKMPKSHERGNFGQEINRLFFQSRNSHNTHYYRRACWTTNSKDWKLPQAARPLPCQ